MESVPQTSGRTHHRSPWRNARARAWKHVAYSMGFSDTRSLLRTDRCFSISNCVALNYQPDPKSLQKPHNSDICRTKCMCGMNHSTIRGGLTLRSPEARMKRRSNQSDTRLRVCKTRMEQNTRSACGGQQSRLIRWISSWPLTLSDGGGDTYKQVASPGPPPLRSRKYHQGAVS